MKCERCQNETNTSYTFSYGDDRKMWGSEEVFICEKCAAIAQRNESVKIIGGSILMGVIVYGLGVAFALQSDNQTEYPILCLGLALLIVALGAVLGYRKLTSKDELVRKNAAEKMAIKLRMSVLQSRGITRYVASTANLQPVGGTPKTGATSSSSKASWQVPDPSNEEEYVRRCLESEFKVEPETRTYQSNPAFATVLTPLNSKQYAQAIKAGQLALSRFPDFDLIYKWMGSAYRATQQLPKSRDILSEGLGKAKRKCLLLTDMGETEWQSGNINNAVYWWAQALHALSADPVDYNAYLLLSYVANGVGLTDFERALLARVDSLRSGKPRLDAATAGRLTTLVKSKKTGTTEKALKGLQSKYFSSP